MKIKRHCKAYSDSRKKNQPNFVQFCKTFLDAIYTWHYKLTVNVYVIIKQVASNKSLLLMKIQKYITQTLKLFTMTIKTECIYISN